jgi:hypothetical protein
VLIAESTAIRLATNGNPDSTVPLRGPLSMVKLLVQLDFACCCCNETISLTVQCEGKGLTDRRRPVAAFEMQCPECREWNQVYFEPNGGAVLRVDPTLETRQRLQPSMN